MTTTAWPPALPCGCPTAGLVAIDADRHDAYHREIGGPARCFRLCWCGTCPQYEQQAAATELLRQQEYDARDRKAGEIAARQAQRANARTYGGPTR